MVMKVSAPVQNHRTNPLYSVVIVRVGSLYNRLLIKSFKSKVYSCVYICHNKPSPATSLGTPNQYRAGPAFVSRTAMILLGMFEEAGWIFILDILVHFRPTNT